MSRRPWPSTDLAIVALLAAVLLLHLATARAAWHEGLVDDAFIFLRVADNLWNGHGWTYNVAEPSNPTTAPLYVLLLTAARAAGMAPETSVVFVYAAALVVACVGLYFVVLPFGRLAAATAALCIPTGAIPILSWGMETALFLACVVWAAFALGRGRAWGTGLLCGLATLCRPEGAAMLGIAAAVSVWRERRIAWQTVLGFGLVVGPWLAFSLLQFGEPLPNSVAIKTIQSRIGWFKNQPSWIEHFLSRPTHPVPTFLMAAIGVATSIRRAGESALAALAVIAFGVIQVAAYSVMRAPVGYFWYLAPGLLALDLAIILGFFNGAALVAERLAASASGAGTARILPRLLPVLALAASTQLIDAPFSRVMPYRLGSEYAAIGRWIDANTRPDAIVAATEIGTLGHYSKRTMRDAHGLLHPEAVPRLLQEEWDWWFEAPMPDVVVLHRPAWHGEPSRKLGWTKPKLVAFRTGFCLVKATPQLAVYQDRRSARTCLAPPAGTRGPDAALGLRTRPEGGSAPGRLR